MEGVLRSWAVPKGPSYDTGREAARGARRGPSDRVRRLRGHDPRGQLRRRRGDRVGPGRVGADRRSARRAGQGQAPVRAPGLQAARHLDPGEDQEGREGVAAHQGARRLGLRPSACRRPSRCCPGSPWRTSRRAGIAARPSAPSSPASARHAARSKPSRASPMLAETAERPFSRAGWLFEPKLDGYRVLAARRERRGPAAHPERQRVRRRLSRGGARGRRAAVRPAACSTARWWRSTTGASRAFSGCRAGRGSAARSTSVTRRSRPRSPTTPSTCSASRTSTSRPLPLTTRKALLQRVLPPLGALRYLEHVEEDGEALYREAERLGLEGVVAKKGAAPYKAGR